MVGSLVRWLVKLWDEGLDVQLSIGLDLIGPVRLDAREEVGEPLAGYIVADDDKE